MKVDFLSFLCLDSKRQASSERERKRKISRYNHRRLNLHVSSSFLLIRKYSPMKCSVHWVTSAWEISLCLNTFTWYRPLAEDLASSILLINAVQLSRTDGCECCAGLFVFSFSAWVSLVLVVKMKSENWGQSQCYWWGLIIPTRTPTFKPPSTEQYTTTHSDRELQYHYCVNWNGEWREKVGEKLRFNLQTLCYQFNTTALSPAPLWQRQVCGWDREKESLSLILFGEKYFDIEYLNMFSWQQTGLSCKYYSGS